MDIQPRGTSVRQQEIYFKAMSVIRLAEKNQRLQFPLQCNESDENDGSQVVETIGRGVRI
jgi:hypothetical protein